MRDMIMSHHHHDTHINFSFVYFGIKMPIIIVLLILQWKCVRGKGKKDKSLK
jgi:hypothetical protein